MPYQRSATVKGGSGVSTQVSVAAADIAVVGNNPSRIQLTIVNTGATNVYLRLATHLTGAAPGTPTVDTATTANGHVYLKSAGGSWTTDSYTGPVRAIGDAAGPSVLTVAEF